MEEFSYDDISTIIPMLVMLVVMTIAAMTILVLVINHDGPVVCVEYSSRDVYVKHGNRYYQEKEDVCIRYERIEKESDDNG